MKKRKLNIKIFKSHEDQEKADIKYYKRLSHEKKLQELEELRKFYFLLKYGNIPRLRRFCRIVKRKWG